MTLVPELRLEVQDAAERHASRGASRRPTWRDLGRRGALLASSGIALCCVIITVAAILLLSATSATPPAYALTAHPDGSYTLRIYTLSRDIHQLNAKLKALGIDVTVVPMTNGCPYDTVNYPVSGQMSITLRPNHYDLAPGYQGVLAASIRPDGRLTYLQGAWPANHIPSCVSTHHVQMIFPGHSSTTTNSRPDPTTSTSYYATGGDRQAQA